MACVCGVVFPSRGKAQQRYYPLLRDPGNAVGSAIVLPDFQPSFDAVYRAVHWLSKKAIEKNTQSGYNEVSKTRGSEEKA